MSQTLTSLFVQLVFSTKSRERLITPEVEPDLFAYMGGILKNHQSRLLDAGGTDDHVHLLVSQSKNIALASLLNEVKGDSSSDQVARPASSATFIGKMVMVLSRLPIEISQR